MPRMIIGAEEKMEETIHLCEYITASITSNVSLCVHLYVILGWVCLLYVHFLLAPPILLGVWSMVPGLWMPPKYH